MARTACSPPARRLHATTGTMRFLIYGAGNIGSLYAGRLSEAGHDVTVIARGERLARIQEHGIELEDTVSGTKTTTSVQATAHLAPKAAYDLVLVVVPKQQVPAVLPSLADSEATPAVMFFGNNAAGPGSLIEALGAARVLLGFPGAAGVADNHVIRYLITSAREQPTTIGELDGRRSARVVRTASALEAAGFPTSICANMDAWLKTHVAKILPTVGAVFRAGSAARLADDKECLRLMVRSIRESFRVLKAHGIAITPSNHRLLEWIPEPLLLSLMRRMLTADEAAIKLGHARHGQSEWQLLAAEFRQLMSTSKVPTPATDLLFASIDKPHAGRPSDAHSPAIALL